MHVPRQPFTEELLLRLEELLADPALERAMRLDQAQGYLCAALTGPRPIPERQRLSDLLGEDKALSSPAGHEAGELLRSLAADLEASLTRGEPPLLLLYAKDGGDDSDSDYAPWCNAYLHAVELSPSAWFAALGAEEGNEDGEEVSFLDEQLFPLFVLTGQAEAAAGAAGEEWLSGKEIDRLSAECREKLPGAVAEIFRFWLAWRSVRTIRREQAKIGRNEPCPCGSGKKFKRCCGATAGDEATFA